MPQGKGRPKGEGQKHTQTAGFITLEERSGPKGESLAPHYSFQRERGKQGEGKKEREKSGGPGLGTAKPKQEGWGPLPRIRGYMGFCGIIALYYCLEPLPRLCEYLGSGPQCLDRGGPGLGAARAEPSGKEPF